MGVFGRREAERGELGVLLRRDMPIGTLKLGCFLISETGTTTVKAARRPESSRHKFRPPSGSPNILRICSCEWMASG